ncbi:MAG TPA: hypothetical protein VEF76_03970 [Patescibacteria group bacterium]|nr:hypothetical protein [Patescibacteria group bacterium]
MIKYLPVLAAMLLTAAPALADEEIAPVDLSTPAAQDWKQKWGQGRAAVQEAAQAKYQSLSPQDKAALESRIELAKKLRAEKAKEWQAAHGEDQAAMTAEARKNFEAWKRDHADEAKKYGDKAKDVYAAYKAKQDGEDYVAAEKIRDLKYHNMDEARDAQRAYRDYARTHPGVDAAADKAKAWWSARQKQ